ncbi:MAG: uracil-DNA glycosylase [Arenicellales bacterium]
MMTMADRQKQILADMGIDVWLLRDNTGAAGASVPAEVSKSTASGISIIAAAKDLGRPADSDAVTAFTLLQNEVKNCRLCDLSKSRTQTVFGTGTAQAGLLLIGEAPGAEEDRQGKPFVGKAGKLLDAMLFAIGFDRSQVFICNVLKCRPPNNRDPKPEEVEACAPFLTAQIDTVKPKVILALGRFAAHRLLKTEAPVYKMREARNVLPGTDIPVVVTYHPASLLRNPEQKAQAWQDLCRVHQLLESSLI